MGLYVYSLQSVVSLLCLKLCASCLLVIWGFSPPSLRFTLVSLNMLNNRFSFEENPYIYLEFYFTGAAKFLCISVSILVYMLLLELLDLLRE